MGITAKSKASSKSVDNWGMGFFLVFLPEHHDDDGNNSPSVAPTAATATIVDKAAAAPTTSSFSSPSPSSAKSIKRTNSNINPILSKTQSTLSICVLLLFLSLLLFTLSTFEPSIPTPTTSITPRGRRFLSEKPRTNFWVPQIWTKDKVGLSQNVALTTTAFALQGMGKLFLRGTRAMSDLVVAHVVEDTNEADLRLFLRVLHRSGLTARADTVFIFPSSSMESKFEGLIQEENDSFLKLVHRYKELANKKSHGSVSAAGFDVSRFVISGKKEFREPLWGKRIRVGNYNESEETEDDSIRLSYGSIVGFEASELDPEDSLAGFLDHVPMSLKRWACYPMLLGRVRRNFKRIMLVDAKNLVLLNDPLSRIRNQSPESVYISTKETSSGKHRRNSEKGQSHSQVNSAILMGGARGIRRFSSSMLTEIARVAMQHKKKSSVTESGIFAQLVGNLHILKNINLITSAESIPDSSSLTGLNPNPNPNPKLLVWDYYSIIQRGNTHDLNSIIMKQICSCELDSSVYKDC